MGGIRKKRSQATMGSKREKRSRERKREREIEEEEEEEWIYNYNFNPQEDDDDDDDEWPPELKHLNERFQIDLKQWPPLWKKEIKESPQYVFGYITTIIDDTYDLETRLKQTEFYLPFKRYVQQVKESRGYDVDGEFPSPTFGVTTDVYIEGNYYKESLAQEMVYLLAKINTHARLHQKRYELLKIEKIVDARGHRTDFITISVKEVELGNVDVDVDVVEENIDVIQAKEIALANVDVANHFQTMMKTKTKMKTNYKEVALENVVKKTIQAMVFVPMRGFYSLMEWRFKPEGEGSGSPALEAGVP